MTEPLIIFSIIAMLIVFLLWERYTNTITSIFFGAILGLCLLVKGSMIFLPVLFIPYCILSMRKRKIDRWLRYTFALAGFFVFVVGTWSSIISNQTGRFVLLSTQSTSVLLDGNNEYSVRKSAKWRPEWRGDDSSFYNQEEIRKLPTSVKVFLFLKSNIRQVPGLIDDKIRLGFTTPYLFLIILLFFLESYSAYRKNTKTGKHGGIDLLAGSILLFVLTYFGPMGLGHSYLYLAFGVLSLRVLVIRNDVFFIPVPMVLIFVNFLLLSILIFGDRRFTMVMDSLIILTAYSYALKTFLTFVSPPPRVSTPC